MDALGHIIEGVLEVNPVTERLQILSVGVDGKSQTVDIQDLLKQYLGQEVRLTLASFETLAELAKMLEDAGGGQVFGITPDQLPNVPFNIVRK